MAGFSLSPDELAAVCVRMRAQADAVHEQMRQAGGRRQSGTADFGGSRYAGLAALYGDVLDEIIPRMVGEFRAATTAMSTGEFSQFVASLRPVAVPAA
jgi:hypothetical protein